MKTKKITQRYYIKVEQYGQTKDYSAEVSDLAYHDWAALLNQLSAYDGKKWGKISGMTEKYGWVEGYAVSNQEVS